MPGPRRLEDQHTPHAIASRLAAATEHSYVRDFVFGAVDGTVTTFAIVAGSAGADFSALVAIILGVANLVADGFSMAAGNYLSTKADQQLIDRARRLEAMHIERIPEGEREEIRQIFAAKGFEGELLEQIVDTITSDRQRWIDTMLTEELGLRLEAPSPVRAGLVTFVAFSTAGSIPLLPFLLALDADATFLLSSVCTLVTFFLIGVAKGYVVHRSLFLSGLETLAIGGGAAGLAYVVGLWLQQFGGA